MKVRLQCHQEVSPFPINTINSKIGQNDQICILHCYFVIKLNILYLLGSDDVFRIQKYDN